jgi:hypothetical protein
MDFVLFLRQATHLQQMVLERAEDVRGLWSSSQVVLKQARERSLLSDEHFTVDGTLLED